MIRVDPAEHDRRAQAGLGALSRATVKAMFSLPYGHLVRWPDLDAGLTQFLRRLPDGVIKRSDAGVCRLAVPPVTVELAVVTGLPWGAGLRAAGAFTPFCQRALLLDQRRRIPAGRLWEADYWGIGVWVVTGTGIEQLVAPAPWRQCHVKPAGWAFRERAYDAWLGASGHRPLGGPPGLSGPAGITQGASGPDHELGGVTAELIQEFRRRPPGRSA